MTDDIIRGALVIFYQGRGTDRRFCVTTTSKGGNTSFPKGARDGNESAKENATREAKEELGIDPATYTLQPTGLANRFTFGVTKTAREGKNAAYDIFLADISDLPDSVM
ncbi:MAG: NUDIX domain-containing protein [Candidatus Kerfeldbacteria bacterium]|nr:NUDIX domain-containing protein [Candidatus Kerfeldbacteria bacterium]